MLLTRLLRKLLFSFITQNWRGKPLVNYQTIVQLIAATTTQNGLNVKAQIDHATYQTGRTVQRCWVGCIESALSHLRVK